MRIRRTLSDLATDILAKTHLKGGLVIDDRRLKMVLILATSAAYILAFKPVHLIGGDSVGSLVIFPIALAGWLLGTRPGMIAGILSIPLNAFLYSMIITPALPAVIDAWPAHIAVIIVGAVSGWTGELLVDWSFSPSN